MVKEDSFQLETKDTNIQILKKRKNGALFQISNLELKFSRKMGWSHLLNIHKTRNKEQLPSSYNV
jgi:hypothetical protein